MFFGARLVLPARADRVVSVAVGDKGALRIRHTPCGCRPYDRRLHPHRRARTRKGYAASVTLLRRERLRYRLGAPVQELPNVYKLVRLYCLPLRGRHAEVVVPYDHGTHPSVGRAPAEGYAASVALLAIHTRERTMVNETPPVGLGHVPADRVSGRRYRKTGLYAVSSSRTGL